MSMDPSNQKEFWSTVKLLDAKKHNLPTLVSGNTSATSNPDKANLLNTTFTKNFNYSIPALTSILPDAPDDCPSSFLCTEEEVYVLLSTLDTTKASGHDDISAKMLRETAISITPAVTKLFNISIRLGELPDEWKTARVTPIPKSGDLSNPGNYRPVSLLSILSKLLEKHFRDLLAKHFEEEYPLSAQQWGFTQGKSTTGALLAATDQWFRFLEQGCDICAVFFDYSKAFDTVPHRLLVQKLQGYNVHPLILRWIMSYLSMRTQYVCVDGSSSDILPAISGVPQGSVLGPLLFNIYINDITNVSLSNGSMLLYADDSMLYRPIHTDDDYYHLQLDINKLCTWTDNNLLRYNSTKCKYMVISRRKQPTLPSTSLFVNDSPMERVNSYKYLGVWLNSSLTWSMHVTSICKKARQQIGILYRRFYGHSNSATLLQLYLSYVRPHLEYAAPVWDPHQQGHIDSLERVQKFALKLCTRSWDSSYEDLLNSCHLPTLVQRRRLLKLSFLYQVLHGNYIFPDAPVETCPTPFNLRNRSVSTLYRPMARTNAYKFSFFPHAITLWNMLPPSVTASVSLFSFKCALTKLNL